MNSYGNFITPCKPGLILQFGLLYKVIFLLNDSGLSFLLNDKANRLQFTVCIQCMTTSILSFFKFSNLLTNFMDSFLFRIIYSFQLHESKFKIECIIKLLSKAKYILVVKNLFLLIQQFITRV